MAQDAARFGYARSSSRPPGEREWKAKPVPLRPTPITPAGEQPDASAIEPAIGGRPKRAFDITGAVVAILLLLPLFCLIALIIKLSGRGPVLYRHERIGRNGRPFECLKFRTMMVESDEVLRRHLAANPAAAREWHATQKLKNDPRITNLGHVLRRTSADELPQLFNILKGDMSFVGPRPIVADEIAKYGGAIALYWRARPGLTGPWQVSGRNDVEYQRRVELDRAYVENWRFRRDLVIIFKTFGAVISSRGCY